MGERWNGSHHLENPLLAVSAATITASEAVGFETWLKDDLGSEVLRRIADNRHNASMDKSAAYFDTVDDVQQKALIWLWQQWLADPEFSDYGQAAISLSHRAGILTKIAVINARCMYAKRRREGREKQVDLLFEDGYENPVVTLALAASVRATDIHDHDRPVLHRDKRSDVQAATERVTTRMIADHSIAKGNHRRIPIEHITRTIIEGHMYHYTDRYNQTGNFRQFCETRGVSKNQIARWRPIIFEYLREELQAYMPVSDNADTLAWSGAIFKIRLPQTHPNQQPKQHRSNLLKVRPPKSLIQFSAPPRDTSK